MCRLKESLLSCKPLHVRLSWGSRCIGDHTLVTPGACSAHRSPYLQLPTRGSWFSGLFSVLCSVHFLVLATEMLLKCLCLGKWHKHFFVLSLCPAEAVSLGTAAHEQAASCASPVGRGKKDLDKLNGSIQMEAAEGMAEGIQDWHGLMAPNPKGHRDASMDTCSF